MPIPSKLWRRRALPAALVAAAALGAGAAPAAAAVPHTVEPGETLWSIAAASNFTTRALAAFNGLPADAAVTAGTVILIPGEAEAAAALAGAGTAPGHEHAPADGVAAGDDHHHAHVHPPAAGPAPDPLGAYTVRPGDTLSGLAASAGVAVEQMAYMNGLDPAAPLLAGTVVKLPTGAPPPPQAGAPPPPRRVVPPAPPAPAPGRVTAEQIRQVAAAHGVPGSLAAAVAWQESGFDNDAVSAANARGVMQVLPGTWRWVQDNLAMQRLDPAAPLDNVHAGVMYLGRLLREAGGDETAAVAGYYQGLSSVRRIGLYEDTKRYLANVQALRRRFGGP